VKHFYTNNIADILDTFGIEAARTAIIKEVTAVFDAYGIAVDKRHMLLLADYVTHSGEWLGMSRHSMKACASPIQQMSFETTVQFLTQATLHGYGDQMHSPSASLAAGNVIEIGSGMCDILLPFE
jgi:DNA-directed RNA polymerase I subunit RPA1